MKVKFIGKDGSLGFVNNATYNVITYVESNLFSTKGWIFVQVYNSNLKCAYSNVEMFLENWEVME